ncbi:tetratricopeptide repeat protein [Agromyces humi]|uniref:tetratricopeptide repeat protein n=1 Tax=Agromyces humi TaxID=1766800 RepID=UPI00193A7F23|nr:tetratricopeptide repeat protein [Agromyces humi]
MRIELDLREWLATTAYDVVVLTANDGTYGKERLFRLPSKGRFVGPTHECYLPQDEVRGTLDAATFLEIAKSPAELRTKFERDLKLLRAYSSLHPDDPRWHFYLAETLRGLGHLPEASEEYVRCADLRGWPEEGAWACFRAAQCLLQLGRPLEAISRCAEGMTRHPGIAELPWLVATTCLSIGQVEQAVRWAQIALLGNAARFPEMWSRRVGFREPIALYEGPYDVLRFALRELGDDDAATDAEIAFFAARAERTTRFSIE